MFDPLTLRNFWIIMGLFVGALVVISFMVHHAESKLEREHPCQRHETKCHLELLIIGQSTIVIDSCAPVCVERK